MKEEPGYGAAEAKRIIERAAEIDAERSGVLDAPALRAIALEAGISPTAVDRALQEHATAPPPRGSWMSRHPVLMTLLTLAAALVLVALLRGVALLMP